MLAQLYLRYTELIYGVCLKYLKVPESAGDAVMNIYLELLVSLPRHQVENFRGWLYVFARNHCLMQLRKGKKGVMLPLQDDFMQSEDYSHLDNILEKELELTRLEQCIGKLPERQKLSIRRFYLENKCYKDISVETGMTWDTVRSLIQNGRRNLKICMEKNG